MLSPEEFTGNWPEVEYDSEFENACVKTIESKEKNWSKATLRALPGYKEFYCVPVIGITGDVLLLHRDAYGDYTVTGGYVDETLWVDPGVRGRGLSAEIILQRCADTGEPPQPVSYTAAGRAAHLSAHRLCVTRALSEGYKVPEKALHPIHRSSAT